MAHGYNKYVTRKRYKNIKLNKPLDFYVFDHLFKYINKYNETYHPNSIMINYDSTKLYNYDGPNLQEEINLEYVLYFHFSFM